MSKLKTIFQNLGKAPSQIHKPNIYAQALNEMQIKGDCEKSVKTLFPTTSLDLYRIFFYQLRIHGSTTGNDQKFN